MTNEAPSAGRPGDREPDRAPRTPGDFGEGALGRFTAAVYWFVVVGVLLILASLPSVVLLLLLERASGNMLLAALCLAPVGPGLSAALFALRDREKSDELAPAASFRKGYRLNALDVLRLWVPALLVLGIIAFSLANLGAAGVPTGYGAVLLVIGVGVLLWALHALAIASFFSFRARDVARLAAFYLARMPLTTLGLLSLVIVAGAVVWLTSEAVLTLFLVLWAWFLLQNARPVLRDVEARFTRRQ